MFVICYMLGHSYNEATPHKAHRSNYSSSRTDRSLNIKNPQKKQSVYIKHIKVIRTVNATDISQKTWKLQTDVCSWQRQK